MAASNSVKKARNPRSQAGHISVRKMATPTARGTAINSARIEEITVP